MLDNSDDHVQAAVGSGNIDTSDHVMVFTPGMTSTVGATLAGKGSTDWGDGVTDTDNTLDEARRQLTAQGRDDESVAGVTWLGYDAPNWDETLSLDDSSVLRQDEAREGAASLSSFYNGLQATQLPRAFWHLQYSEVGEDGTPSTSLYNRASVLIGDGVAIPKGK